MTRPLTILALVALPLLGCDHDASPSPAFMSGMGMGSGVSGASAGYGINGNSDATYGSSPSARSDGGVDWMEIRPGQPIDVTRGVLGGDYGDFEIPAESQADLSGFSDGYWTEVNLVVDTPDGVSMAIVEVWGGLDALESGTLRTYDRFADGSDTGTYVSVIGCTGPELYNWTYDSPATEVEVQVSDDPADPSQRIYEFTARFEEVRETWMGMSNEVMRWEMSGRFEGPSGATLGDIATR